MAKNFIRDDLRAALADWKGGKPVHLVELGHNQKIMTRPDGSERINIDAIHTNDQRVIYDYVFHLLEFFAEHGPPESFDVFKTICDEGEQMFKNNGDRELSDEERDGAESLVWKALQVGWRKAIAGHPPEQYFDAKNSAAEAA